LIRYVVSNDRLVGVPARAGGGLPVRVTRLATV
jgi:hypothetical protein